MQKAGCVVERNIVQFRNENGIVFSGDAEASRRYHFAFVFPNVYRRTRLDFSVGKNVYGISRKSENSPKRGSLSRKIGEDDVAAVQFVFAKRQLAQPNDVSGLDLGFERIVQKTDGFDSVEAHGEAEKKNARKKTAQYEIPPAGGFPEKLLVPRLQGHR